MVPFCGALTKQEAAVHVALTKVPELQLETPETAYPRLQEGVQVPPEAKTDEQSPATPFSGGTEASHAPGMVDAETEATWL